MRRTWWSAAILSGIVLFGALGAASRATALEVITVRTGLSGGVPGACPSYDDQWTYNAVAIAPCGQPMRGAPFTPADFADAVAGPHVRVVSPFGGFWINGLPSDSQARWIAHEKTGTCNGDVGSILYACPFVVTTPGATVGDISVCWAVDDRLGDPPGGGPNPVGVYVNGVPLSGSFSGGDFFAQYCATQSGVPLVPGTNYLYVYQRDLFCTTSGVMCTATITVATPPNPHILAVNTTDDTDDGVCDATHCSLREAINAANAQAGSDSIRFAIPGAAPFHLQPLSALPVISTTMAIDATSQAGFAGTPLVEINGLSTPNTTDCLRVTAPDVSIAGLAIGQFHTGISLEGGGATVGLCYVGTDAAGASNHGNREDGIAVLSDGNRIGSATAANLIAGNSDDGILITGSANIVEGNRIGTNAAGTAQMHNGGDGIEISNFTVSCAGNRIGGAAGAGNVISGNSGDGVRVRGSLVTGTMVQGNRIGTSADGTADVGNGVYGVNVEASASGTLVGGIAAGEGNVISGMTSAGVMVNAAAGTVIQGNRIGTNADGSAALANGTGIAVVNFATATQIGGTDPAARNVISGSIVHGLQITSHASGTVVQGNWIGTDATGTFAIPNSSGGTNSTFAVDVAAPDNTIGGTAPGAGNVIAGNTLTGIDVDAARVDVLGNRIGVTASGQPLGNGLDGVIAQGLSTNARIGGRAAGEANEIAFNGRAGVRVFNPVPQGVRVEGNAIHDNTGLGIDLGPLGVAANDPGDIDNGANAGMNFPVLSGATVGTAGLILSGVLETTANMPCRICVYGNLSCDPSGNGEGAVFLGAFDVTSDGAGLAPIAATLLVTSLGSTLTLTCTASDSAGNTSEFSPCLVVQPQPTVVGGPTVPLAFALSTDGQGPSSAAALHLTMPAAGRVRITILDVSGRRVRTVLDGLASAGRQAVRWDGRDDRGALVSSGVYFARAESAGAVALCRVALAR